MDDAARARVQRYIDEYEDAPMWGGPTMYPSPPSIADLRALVASATPPAAPNAEWVIVPNQPTEAMVRATLPAADPTMDDLNFGERVIAGMPPLSKERQRDGMIAAAEVVRDYRAMLAAAPAPQPLDPATVVRKALWDYVNAQSEDDAMLPVLAFLANRDDLLARHIASALADRPVDLGTYGAFVAGDAGGGEP